MPLMIQDKEKTYKEFKQYIEKYGHRYSGNKLNFIISGFEESMKKGIKIDIDILLQIYAYLNILDDNDNIYKGFINLFKEKYSIGRNIVEVGGGPLPINAKYIDEEQQLTRKGSITVYDPKIVVDELGKIRLLKQKIGYDTDLTDADAVIGIAPCEATIISIEKACKRKINFMIATCGHSHFSEKELGSFNCTETYWALHIYQKAVDAMGDMGTVCVDYLDNKYNYPYPILSSQYTKKN